MQEGMKKDGSGEPREKPKLNIGGFDISDSTTKYMSIGIILGFIFIFYLFLRLIFKTPKVKTKKSKKDKKRGNIVKDSKKKVKRD